MDWNGMELNGVSLQYYRLYKIRTQMIIFDLQFDFYRKFDVGEWQHANLCRLLWKAVCERSTV